MPSVSFVGTRILIALVLGCSSCPSCDEPPPSEGEGEGEGDEGERTCRESCVDDDDCAVDGAPGLVCEGARCVLPQIACVDDVLCIAVVTGWTTDCTANAACAQVTTGPCVDVSGNGTAGKCAFPPNGDNCAVGSLVTLDDITGAAVNVCGRAGLCDADVCRAEPCLVDDDCAAPLVCRVGDGECVGCLESADGLCRCEAASDCSRAAFDGTTVVCD